MPRTATENMTSRKNPNAVFVKNKFPVIAARGKSRIVGAIVVTTRTQFADTGPPIAPDDPGACDDDTDRTREWAKGIAAAAQRVNINPVITGSHSAAVVAETSRATRTLLGSLHGQRVRQTPRIRRAILP